jgi:hypothetical protein
MQVPGSGKVTKQTLESCLRDALYSNHTPAVSIVLCFRRLQHKYVADSR